MLAAYLISGQQQQKKRNVKKNMISLHFNHTKQSAFFPLVLLLRASHFFILALSNLALSLKYFILLLHYSWSYYYDDHFNSFGLLVQHKYTQSTHLIVKSQSVMMGFTPTTLLSVLSSLP